MEISNDDLRAVLEARGASPEEIEKLCKASERDDFDDVIDLIKAGVEAEPDNAAGAAEPDLFADLETFTSDDGDDLIDLTGPMEEITKATIVERVDPRLERIEKAISSLAAATKQGLQKAGNPAGIDERLGKIEQQLAQVLGQDMGPTLVMDTGGVQPTPAAAGISEQLQKGAADPENTNVIVGDFNRVASVLKQRLRKAKMDHDLSEYDLSILTNAMASLDSGGDVSEIKQACSAIPGVSF